ncbi:MAG: ketopantoate reductase family protein [Alphaproteobacteria bacterium]|nr:ketopantoate reductase family protein [Alphaproteobacteria bacterium]
MRIAVFGVGGVGGYFGARLAASGADVVFIARGAHLAAMQSRGLRLESGFGDLTLAPVTASDDPAAIGPVDVVHFTVKLYDVESAAARLRPMLKPDTAVIAFQNGIDAEERIGRAIPAAHVVGGVAYISATIAEPGLIRHLNKVHKLAFGEMDGRTSPRLEALLAACRKAGFDAELTADIRRALWEKFVFLAPMAAATGATRQPIGPILADPDLRRLFSDLIAEAIAVARTQGLELAPDMLERTIRTAASLPGTMKASLAHDLEKGARLEIEGLSGTLVRLGEAAGIAVPTHRALYAALKPFAAGRNS